MSRLWAVLDYDLNRAFHALPPRLRVFLVRVGSAAGTAAAATAVEALRPIVFGSAPITRETLVGVLTAALVSGWTAGKAFVAQSPEPRRIWTEAERRAAKLREAEEAAAAKEQE